MKAFPCYPITAPPIPKRLSEIPGAPAQLYMRGRSLYALDAPMVAIVGARSCSDYGAAVARHLGRDLAAAGVCVVSGLARGVNAEAHRGALEVPGGLTLAVLGNGIDRDYPRANAQLAEQIVEQGGLIVSEYEPGVPPAPWQFPARNRIVAGLAQAVVVVEARERSGALITADFALEYGRKLLAVPGEITSSLSAGSNQLLRAGGEACLTAADVLEAIGLTPPDPAEATPTAVGPRRSDEQQLRDGLAAADQHDIQREFKW